jgi:hypothetical protein
MFFLLWLRRRSFDGRKTVLLGADESPATDRRITCTLSCRVPVAAFVFVMEPMLGSCSSCRELGFLRCRGFVRRRGPTAVDRLSDVVAAWSPCEAFLFFLTRGSLDAAASRGGFEYLSSASAAVVALSWVSLFPLLSPAAAAEPSSNSTRALSRRRSTDFRLLRRLADSRRRDTAAACDLSTSLTTSFAAASFGA